MEDIIFKDCTHQQLTPSERLKLDLWLKESPENRKIYAQLKLALLYPNEEEKNNIKDEIWTDLKKKVLHASSYEQTRFSAHGFMWLKIAAVFVISLSLLFAIYELADRYGAFNPNVVEVKVIEKVSLPGQKITTMLPDGTTVTLNADSRLIVPAHFKENIREVNLQGEAYFDVARDETRPFVITTDNIKVEVLGTSFNVKSYGEGSLGSVAVASGKVAVSKVGSLHEKVDLKPGEKVNFQPKGLSEKIPFNWEEEFGWKENILLFKGEDLNEILETLRKWYGVKFHIETTRIEFNKRFSGRYKDASLKAVLEGLSFVYNFSYSMEGKTVTLK